MSYDLDPDTGHPIDRLVLDGRIDYNEAARACLLDVERYRALGHAAEAAASAAAAQTLALLALHETLEGILETLREQAA